jgi:ABC-2 type transport system ATP-binding protein
MCQQRCAQLHAILRAVGGRLEEAEELCEEIAIMRGGRVLARDSATGLRSSYEADSLADVYVKAMAS